MVKTTTSICSQHHILDILEMVNQNRRSQVGSRYETGRCVNALNGGYDIWPFVSMPWVCWFAKPKHRIPGTCWMTALFL